MIAGAGSWGTALSHLFSRRIDSLTLWCRSHEAAQAIQRDRVNARYLPGIRLSDNIDCTSSLRRAATGSSIVVLAVPSHAVAELCHQLESCLEPEALLLSGVKGLERDSGLRISEIIERGLPGIADRLAVLSGPNLAGEAADGMPTATVVASRRPDVARTVQLALSLPLFRIYTNSDVIGVELGGALKNIVAIAAGISDGLGYGDNTKAALVSRGLNEIRRLGRALGADDATFSGLSGIGDLYATCASSQSRNHRVGLELGQGRSLREILKDMDQIAEGVETTRAAMALRDRHNAEMPITEGLFRVLFQGESAEATVRALMARAYAGEE